MTTLEQALAQWASRPRPEPHMPTYGMTVPDPAASPYVPVPPPADPDPPAAG